VTVTGTQADGKPTSQKYTEPKKGGPLNFSEGDPTGASVVSKKINDRTRENIMTRDGKVVVTAKFVLSADGKTTITRKGTNQQGQPINRVEVWERQ